MKGHLNWCRTGSPELGNWIRTIQAIKPHIVQSRLTIRVAFAYGPGHWALPINIPTGELTFTREEFQHRKMCYFNTVLPLRALGPFKSFTVFIFADMEDPEGEIDYAEEWNYELMEQVQGPSYEHRYKWWYEENDLPVPLFERWGRWFIDHECGV